MLSPESAEEKEGAWRLRVEREMPTLSDAEIDHGLGAIGGGCGTESVEGGAFPDSKRPRLVEKLEIVVEDDEGMEEDKEEDEGKEEVKEEEQKMEEIGFDTDVKEIGFDTDVKEKEKTEFDLIEIAKSGIPLMGCGLSDREIDVIMSMRRHAMDISDDDDDDEEEVDEKVKEILDNSERYFPICYPWNRLPEVDSQYVYLFTQLDESVLFHQKSWSFYLEEPSHSSRHADYLKARDIARSLNLDKLRDDDILQCFVDVFAVRDRIAEYKLKTEYALFLLECRYNQNLHLKNFTPKNHSPIMDRLHFDPSRQQWKFDRWMEKNCLGLQKEECQIAITDHYEKRQIEDFNYRIHYIRYTRGLAKELGLIP